MCVDYLYNSINRSMYNTVMVITCYVPRGKVFKKISLTINSSSGILRSRFYIRQNILPEHILKTVLFFTPISFFDIFTS